ncbi:MAG: head GIN domain-containing protein [Flavobacteriaceae bacterium]|nr:head GIN domain-containing protein [Flavobacteriaceae bacterium]MDZ4149375.1 head GIN domain-containing protein [Flavobacteriaceae bacterium]
MKKHILILALILISSSTFAQGWFGKIKGNGNVITEKRSTEAYDEISVGGSFEVQLVSGSEGNITLEGEENILEVVETEVKNGELKIRFRDHVNVQTHKKIKVTVPFKDLRGVTLAGSGKIYSDVTVFTASFEAKVSGSGNIRIPVEAQKTIAHVTGSGDINLSGKTEDLEVKVTGSGDFDGRSLSSNNTSASVTGSGDITVVSNQKIYARVTGSGDILYLGKPEKEDIKVTGSGKVRMME